MQQKHYPPQKNGILYEATSQHKTIFRYPQSRFTAFGYKAGICGDGLLDNIGFKNGECYTGGARPC